MDKKQFLELLQERLKGFPEEDIKKSIDYYGEIIDDRTENGESEEEAVASLGSIDDIVSKILEDTSLPRIVKERVTQKKSFEGWEILLIILGAPLWIPLLIAAAALILSLFIIILSVVITMFALSVSFCAVTVGLLAAAVIFLLTGKGIQGILVIGCSLIFAGISVIGIILSCLTVKGIIYVSKCIIKGIKSAFIKKGDKK